MPDITLQSVGQDVGESSTDHKEEENSEDHNQNESSTIQEEAKISNKHKGENNTDKYKTTQGGVLCKICLVTLTSEGQADKHFNGLRHKTAVTSLIEHTRESSAGATPPQKKKSKDINFFCEFCLIKLTSPSQLDIHFKGKKHQRALAASKDLSRSLVELAASPECIQSLQDVDNVCVVRPASRSSDDPTCEESSQSEALAENTASSKTTISSATAQSTNEAADGSGNNQKEGTHSQIKSKKSKKPKGEEITCSVCSVKLTSKSQAETHYEGMKHKRALATASGQTRPIPSFFRNHNMYSDFAAQNFHPFAYRNTYDQRMGYSMPPSAPRMKPKNEKETECVCRICVVKLTSILQAVMHYEGRQHRKAAALVAANSLQTAAEENQKTELVCEVCHVTLTSQPVADNHYASSRHKKKVQLFQSRYGGLVPETQGKPDTPGMCGICNVALPSKVVADAHYAGAKHNKKLQIIQSLLGNGKSSESPSGNGKSSESLSGNRKTSESPSGNGEANASPSGNGEASNVGTQASAPLVVTSSSSNQVTESSTISVMSSTGELLDEQRKALSGNLFSCDICKVKGTSQQAMEDHYRGQDHSSLP